MNNTELLTCHIEIFTEVRHIAKECGGNECLLTVV